MNSPSSLEISQFKDWLNNRHTQRLAAALTQEKERQIEVLCALVPDTTNIGPILRAVATLRSIKQTLTLINNIQQENIWEQTPKEQQNQETF